MEWIERWNQAIDYLEAHLTEDLDYGKLGTIACCSGYHFQRMFVYLAGVPLSEYVRRRKMSLAAVDLRQEGAKILDVAQKYGYHSPTAFNRAFQSVHGLAPSKVREEGSAVKAFPPLAFQISVKGAEPLIYRIENKPTLRLVGRSHPLNQEIEKNFLEVPQMWSRAAQDGTVQRLAQKMDVPPMGLFGVSACNQREEWRYYIAVSTTQPAGEFEEYLLPAATWAIFPGEGPVQDMQELERRIITEWLPNSGYEYADAPDVECYLNPDPEHARYEVWIPVVKRAE